MKRFVVIWDRQNPWFTLFQEGPELDFFLTRGHQIETETYLPSLDDAISWFREWVRM